LAAAVPIRAAREEGCQYDAGSESKGDKNLWTTRSFKNFEARVDWRIKEAPYRAEGPLGSVSGSRQLGCRHRRQHIRSQGMGRLVGGGSGSAIGRDEGSVLD
jgi:hypothetical protein